MLKSLTVTNFALIEQAGVEFAGGLNVLTGETGAGKSILVDALTTLLGSRADREAIRSGCESFRVEAVFDIAANAGVKAILDDQDIPLDDGATLILSRFLSRQGKTAILANGCHVTVGVLRQIGEGLVDIHGQHEHQALLRPEAHLAMIDSFLPPAGRETLARYRRLYASWNELGAALARTESDSRERAQRLDMLAWQTKEIAAAALQADEEEQLAGDIRILGNAEKIVSAVNRVYGLLAEGGRGSGGVLSDLADCRKELEIAARFDPALEAKMAVISDTLYQLEDIAAELGNYRENVEFDPGRLAKLQERMDIIHGLKRKYGATVAAVLAYHRQAAAELADITNYEERLAALTAERAAVEKDLAQAAGGLDTVRRATAAGLADKIRAHLADLGMPHAAFLIDIKAPARFTPAGSEAAALFSANPGEEAKPLAKVASGGELSRIALAIKTVAASAGGVGTMIFDEVDAGIGGQTARMVAEKIALVSVDKQVLCVTHLPQVAAMADRHLAVEKHVAGDRTQTVVRILDGPAHRREVTRMISGDNMTQAALDNAAEMINSAQLSKEKWKNKA